MKRCAWCHGLKDIEHFHVDRSRPDGHVIYCRECKSARERELHSWRRCRRLNRQMREADEQWREASKAVRLLKGKHSGRLPADGSIADLKNPG